MRMRTLFYIIFLTLLSACSNKVEKKLNSIESYIDEYPDSALIVLDALQYEVDLSSNTSNIFNLLYVTAKNKVGEDITNDTLVFDAVKYFRGKNDVLRLSLASLYSGRVHQARQEMQEAMKCYTDAEESAEKLKGEEKLKGLIQSSIGDMLLSEFYIEEAIAKYLESEKFFINISDFPNISMINNSLGICYSFLENNENTATFHFNKAFHIADSIDNRGLKTMTKGNMAFISLERVNFSETIKYFNEALSYAPSKLDSIHLYHNIAEAYNTVGNGDSSLFYIDKIYEYDFNIIPYELNKNINLVKANILKENFQYEEALELYEDFAKYADTEYDKFKETNILEIQKKYKVEVMQNKHNEDLIAKQRLIIGLLLLVITSSTFGIISYIKSVRNKRALLDANNKILEFTEIVEDYNSEKDSLKKIVLDHFDILKKAALIDNLIKKTDKDNGQKILDRFNQIIYGQNELNWDILYNTMNKAYDGQLGKVRIVFPELDDTDFKICCLVYAKFSRKEISLLLSLSASTISSRNSSIRKKMGVDDYGNIADFINKLESQ